MSPSRDALLPEPPAHDPCAVVGNERGLRRLVRGGALNLAGTGLAATAGLGLILVAARLAPAKAVCRLFAWTALRHRTHAAVKFGADQGIVRFVAAQRVGGR